MRIRWLATLLLVAAGCSSERSDWTEESAVVSQLLSAVVARDTAAVATLSTEDVGDRLSTMRQLDPTLLDAAASGMEIIEARVVSRDTIYISFRPRNGLAREVLDFGLARSSAGWRVYYFTVPSRM